MIDPTSRRFASPVVAHRVLDGAFASVSTCAMSAHGKMRPARARRRGQALLIAVLLMVFAAVLGATFVTVVALNLNQTARSGSVNTARVAAIAGRNYVNEQLTNSPLGENWRPQLDASQPSASGDTYYYTDFERAQGWDQPDATTETVGGYPSPTSTKPQFVKFPDPRSTAITGNNTPTYLTKVEPVVAPLATDPDHERDGQLKVTVIGRASDNDAAYSPLVFYKPTSRNGNMTSFARYDSNWNFGTNSLLTTKISGDVTTPNTVITLAQTHGMTPSRTILIGMAEDPANLRACIIKRVGPDDPNAPVSAVPLLKNQVELNQAIKVADGEPVRAASTYVGGLPKIDARGTESTVLTTLQDTAIPSETASGGILINNALLLQGKSQFTLNTTGTKPDRVLIAGPVSIQGGANTFANVSDGSATEDIKTATTLKPFVRYQQSEGIDPTDPTQIVHPMTPARLDSPNSRWLQLTKLTGDVGAFYGYGGGLYIDNREDIEKVGVVSNASTYGRTTWRALTISETQRLLARKSFLSKSFVPTTQVPIGNSETGNIADTSLAASMIFSTTNTTKGEYADGSFAHRLSWPRIVPSPPILPATQPYSFPVVPNVPITNPTPTPTPLQDPSLEERGVRGWISPTEFLPRGTLIELQGNEAVITRDDLSDQSQWLRDTDGDALNKSGVKATDASVPPDITNGLATNPAHNYPDANKAWKNTDGQPLTTPGARTYRMRINLTTGARFLGAPGGNDLPSSAPLPANGFNGVIYAEGNVRVRGFSDKDVTIVSMGNIYVEGGINRTGGHIALLAKRNVVLNPMQFAARPSGLQVRNLVPSGTLQNNPPGPFTSASPTIDVPVAEVSGFRVGDSVRIGNPEQTLMITSISAASGSGTITLANPNLVTVTAADLSAIPVLDDASLSTATGKGAYVLANSSSTFTRDMLRDNSPTTGIYQLALIHAGQLSPIGRRVNITRQLAPGNTVDIKKEVTIDGIIKSLDGEKTIAAAGSPTYDLTTAPTDTLGGLRDRFTMRPPTIPVDPDPNWDLTLDNDVIMSATSSHRLAAASAINLIAGTPRPFLLTTSVGGFWQNPTAPNFIVGTGFLPADDEDLRTVQESFYGVYNPLAVGPTDPFSQAGLQGMTYQLPTAPTLTGNNTISLRRAVTTDTLVNYFIAGVKYDRDTFANVAAAPVNVNVEATIYAQDGSWFVIPMPTMTPNNAAPTTFQTDQANRYRRLNYQITVQASIGENFAPTGLFDYDTEQTPDQSPATTQAMGAQAQWLDTSAYPTPTAPVGTEWQTINYVAPLSLPSTNTLYLPITPDITNQR